MKMFNEEQEKQLKEIFAAMKRDVTIALFTEPGCYTCPETDGLLDEIAAMSERIRLVRYDLNDCWPSSWKGLQLDGMGSEALVEELELQVRFIQRVAA